MRKNNSIIYIFIFTLCLLFIGAPFFNYVATNTWQLSFITEENYDAWISYYGSVIGGSLTLLGVWWTINDQENKRREDLAIQYRPLLVIESKNITNPYLDGNNIQTLLNTLKLRNIGRAEAINITIHAPFNYPFIHIVQNDYIPMLEQNNEIDYVISTNKILETDDIIRGKIANIQNDDVINHQIIIEYEDIMRNTYRCCFHLNIAYGFVIKAEDFDGMTLIDGQLTINKYNPKDPPKQQWNTQIKKDSYVIIEKRSMDKIFEKQYLKAQKEYAEYVKKTKHVNSNQ